MPFVVTIVVALLASSYIMLDPTKWLQDLFELTFLSTDFKIVLLTIAISGFACSWLAEKHLLPQLAKTIGRVKDRSRPKQQKLYKMLEQEMRI